MIPCMNISSKRSLTVFLMLLVFLIAGIGLPPQAFSQEVPFSIPGIAVPLKGDPTPGNLYVPARVGPLSMVPLAVTSTINVNWVTGTGFWGDNCVTPPVSVNTAVAAAADIWASYLTSAPPINIEACWTSWADTTIIGKGGPYTFQRDFTGARATDTWFTDAAANAQYGADLDPSNPEIAIAFNSPAGWYTSTSGSVPANQYDLVTAALREIAYGLGFVGSMDVTAGTGSWGLPLGLGPPVAYDRFAVNGSDQSLIDTALFDNSSPALAAQLQSGSVFFNGAGAVAANSGANVRLYAPATWNDTSYRHLDQATFGGTVNALMTPTLGMATSIHDPGPVALAMLRDVGNNIASGCSYSLNLQGNSFAAAGGTGSFNVVAVPGCPWSAASSATSWLHVTSGSSGSGNGTIEYSVDNYTSVPVRNANINVADKSFIVTQHGVLPVADFSGNNLTGSAPLIVTFTNQSTNGSTWSWDFGDGQTSTAQDPVHTYLVRGNFTVSLTATNVNGSDTAMKTGYIHDVTCTTDPVRYSGSKYQTTIGAAYSDAASVDELDLQAGQGVYFTETLNFNLGKTVTLKGGYNCAYDASRVAYPETVLNGSLTVVNGAVTVDDFVIR